MKFLREADVGSFRHDTVLVQTGEDTDWVWQFDEVDCRLEVTTEVDELPLDLFTCILFLLQYEHVVVEKLLQLLVRIIDAELLKTVFVEDLKSSDIQNSNEVRIIASRPSLVQLSVDAGDEVAETALIYTLGKGIDCKIHSLGCLHLFNPLASGLYSRME